MPEHDKLQQLFNAALKSRTEDYHRKPADMRAVPTPRSADVPAATAAAVPRPAVVVDSPAVAEVPPRGLSAAESEKLGTLLDEQNHRRKRGHRMEALVTALVLFGMSGGGLAWFVQDNKRVQAFQEALRDIRSVGDIKSLVASYQDSLDRIAARSNQIDDTSRAMGIDPSKGTGEDPYMETEMQEMMGEEGGQTVGSRNKRMMENFGHIAGKNGVDTTREFAASDAAKEKPFNWD